MDGDGGEGDGEGESCGGGDIGESGEEEGEEEGEDELEVLAGHSVVGGHKKKDKRKKKRKKRLTDVERQSLLKREEVQVYYTFVHSVSTAHLYLSLPHRPMHFAMPTRST